MKSRSKSPPGAEPVKALLDSSASRFRPVMMASMTTILGMIPLLGDPLFGPGAVAIMGGLLYRHAHHPVVRPGAVRVVFPYQETLDLYAKTQRREGNFK